MVTVFVKEGQIEDICIEGRSAGYYADVVKNTHNPLPWADQLYCNNDME